MDRGLDNYWNTQDSAAKKDGEGDKMDSAGAIGSDAVAPSSAVTNGVDPAL